MSQIKKSMVFIDAGNLIMGWRDFCRKFGHVEKDKKSGKEQLKRISCSNLIKEISKNADFIRGYFFDSVPGPVKTGKQRFFDMLRSNKITVVTKALKYKSVKCKHCSKIDMNIPHQKGVDVSLATEMMGLAFERAYDIAIIISGDSDFVDAIKPLNHIRMYELMKDLRIFDRRVLPTDLGFISEEEFNRQACTFLRVLILNLFISPIFS